MSRSSLEGRAYFRAVARFVVANPFSAEREAAERALDDGPAAGRTERIGGALRRRLAALERDGAPLRRCAAGERAALAHAYLLALYLEWSSAFDELIGAQEREPDEPCAVPFASELLATMEARGFARDEAKKNLALFFQLRRAYAFIDRALLGASASMRGLREALWNDVFTRDIRGYEAFLWGRMEDFSTLLLGETGTGKGSAARAIGQSGFIPFDERRGAFAESFARAFVPVNLAEFPESLLESELFGHEKGAFTGALERREGIFAQGSPHGSIFLDEIGELGAPVQIKLLRVLQERVYTPVGARRPKRFRGRVIAATNRTLAELRAGLLREDFYYRLCSDVIVVPPLRTRLAEDPDELGRLVAFLLARTLGADAGALAAEVAAAIERDLGRDHAWPGNVRELEQCVRRVLLKGRCDAGTEARAGGERSVPRPRGRRRARRRRAPGRLLRAPPGRARQPRGRRAAHPPRPAHGQALRRARRAPRAGLTPARCAARTRPREERPRIAAIECFLHERHLLDRGVSAHRLA